VNEIKSEETGYHVEARLYTWNCISRDKKESRLRTHRREEGVFR